MAFVRRVDHSSFILSCNLIGQRENKSRYVTEIVLPLGYADVIFRRRESRQPEIRLRSQATPSLYLIKDFFQPRLSENKRHQFYSKTVKKSYFSMPNTSRRLIHRNDSLNTLMNFIHNLFISPASCLFNR